MQSTEHNHKRACVGKLGLSWVTATEQFQSYLDNKEGAEEVPVLYEEFPTGDYTRILMKANTKV